MTGPASRRGFLRGLTTLPLIGGSVALVGTPSAVAGPPSEKLMGAYLEWLRIERDLLGQDLGLLDRFGEVPMMPGAGAAQLFHRDNLRVGSAAAPAARAALVLAAVGLDPDAPLRVDGRWR